MSDTEHNENRSAAHAPDLLGPIARMLGDAVFELDPTNRRIHWSMDVAAYLLNYEPGERDLQWDTLLQTTMEEDRSKLEAALAALLGGGRADVEVRLRRKDGDFCWVHIIGGTVQVQDEQPPRIAGILRDVDELRSALVSLGEARRMESIGNIASGIAHEFNNHLTPIRGYIELALDELGKSHDELAEGLRAALERVNYCSDLVAQIQAYGRKSMLMPEFVLIDRLIPPTARLAISSFPDVSERIAVIEEWPADLPPVWVDQGQFQQALLHLFRNAIEAMPEGGTLAIHADEIFEAGNLSDDTSQESDERFMRISVTDTGKGISPEHRARIFEPFFTTHGRAAARGMGLPMVQGMVAQHGGWMEIKTDVGQGTTVALYLPIKEQPADKKATVDADGTMPVDHAASPGRMLLADDEPFIRRLIRKIFEAEGWEVDEVADNDAVLEKMRDPGKAYGLVVLDLTMPGASTEETIHRIWEKDSATPVLFISGYARDARIERLLEMGNSEFISKPFSPKELLSRVDALI